MIKKLFGIFLVLVFVCGLFVSCGVLKSVYGPSEPQQALILTTQQDIRPDTPPELIKLVPPELIPDPVKEGLGVTDTNKAVITTKDNLRSDHIPGKLDSEPKYVQLDNLNLSVSNIWSDLFNDETFTGILLGVAKGLGVSSPFFLGLEGLLTLMSSRKRMHYGNAAKSIGNLNVADALGSVWKALGSGHSNSVTEVPPAS